MASTTVKEHFLEEEDGHVVSFSEHGNMEGPPILSFHGGPGSKSKRHHAERFDLSTYRVILFDQRGCGKSTPLGSIENNTTDDLLGDAERIREKLGIERWFVSGGSWGSTLSLLYAIKHPERTRGILINGVFLADRDSVRWSMEDEDGAARLAPDAWQRRAELFERLGIRLETWSADVLRVIETGSVEDRKAVVAGVQNWEYNLFSTQARMSYKEPEEVTEEDIASVKIFVHYEAQHAFLLDSYILKQLPTIARIPIVIVHGRYDIVCPLQKAKRLADAMANSELVIADASGHMLTNEGTTIQKMAYDRFLERYR